MLSRLVCAATLYLVAILPLAAQEGQPQSKRAKEAQAKYDKDLGELSKMYQSYHTEMLKAFIETLKEARSQALKDDDLDEAQRIVAKIKEAETRLKEGEPVKPSDKFEIIIAYWGVTAPGSGIFEKNWVDVTKSLQKRVKLGRLSSTRPPDDFKQDGIADPWPKLVKSLVIVYSQNSRIQIAILDAWQPLTLPK